MCVRWCWLARTSVCMLHRVMSVGRQEGFADDYSFLIQGLIDLFEASQVIHFIYYSGTTVHVV